MKSGRYVKALVLANYVRRFRDQPPSILTDDAAFNLMERALRRGTPITELDLAPEGSPPSVHRRDVA